MNANATATATKIDGTRVPAGDLFPAEPTPAPCQDIGFIHTGREAQFKIGTLDFEPFRPIKGKGASISNDAVDQLSNGAQANDGYRYGAQSTPQIPASGYCRDCRHEDGQAKDCEISFIVKSTSDWMMQTVRDGEFKYPGDRRLIIFRSDILL